MTPQEVAKHINNVVSVNSPKISGEMLFTAYIFRIINGKKVYQAEVRNMNPPHELYIVNLADLKGEK